MAVLIQLKRAFYLDEDRAYVQVLCNPKPITSPVGTALEKMLGEKWVKLWEFEGAEWVVPASEVVSVISNPSEELLNVVRESEVFIDVSGE